MATTSRGAMNGHEARVHVDLMKAALRDADYETFYALVEQVSTNHLQAAITIAYLLGHDDGSQPRLVCGCPVEAAQNAQTRHVCTA